MKKFVKSPTGLWYDEDSEVIEPDDLAHLLDQLPDGSSIRVILPDEIDDEEDEDV